MMDTKQVPRKDRIPLAVWPTSEASDVSRVSQEVRLSESGEHDVIARSVESLGRGTRYAWTSCSLAHRVSDAVCIKRDATPNYGFRENELGMRTVLFQINADAYTMWQSSFCRKSEDWDMAPCSLVRWHQRSSRMCLLLFWQMEAARLSGMLVPLYTATTMKTVI